MHTAPHQPQAPGTDARPGGWRTITPLLAGVGILSVAALAFTTSDTVTIGAARTASPSGVTQENDVVPGMTLRATMAHRYTMDGRIRPLLFWFGRDDVGFARIVWRLGDNGERGYELLVGTDPLKAPRSLNRWGYVSEETLGSDGALLALMTGSDETSYEEAEARAKRNASKGDFRAIRARLREGTLTWQAARLDTATALTIHDVEAALQQVREETASSTRRQRQVPAHVRSGFLVSVAELIDRAVQAAQDPRRHGRAAGSRVSYVFARGTYDLELRQVEAVTATIGAKRLRALRTVFEIRTLATGARTKFEVTCGMDGALAGVPVSIEWQPRWWLKVQLRLDEA